MQVAEILLVTGSITQKQQNVKRNALNIIVPLDLRNNVMEKLVFKDEECNLRLCVGLPDDWKRYVRYVLQDTMIH